MSFPFDVSFPLLFILRSHLTTLYQYLRLHSVEIYLNSNKQPPSVDTVSEKKLSPDTLTKYASFRLISSTDRFVVKISPAYKTSKMRPCTDFRFRVRTLTPRIYSSRILTCFIFSSFFTVDIKNIELFIISKAIYLSLNITNSKATHSPHLTRPRSTPKF